MKRPYLVPHLAAALFWILLPGSVFAQSEPQAKSPEEIRAQLRKEVPDTIATFKKADPAIDKFFKDSAGYVVFPRIGKAGFILGGGHGIAEVFEKGKVIGTATMTLVTVGLQAGAQEFSEIIFFQNQAALDRFKGGKFEFAASASAVVLKAGVSKDANYRDGVAVFAHPRGGIMAEAALGTQKFSFKPEPAAAKK